MPIKKIKQSKTRLVFSLTFCFQLLICLNLFSNNVFAENRIALVIGNADYSSSPLSNPVNDALDMSDALRNHDFEVDSFSNLDRKGMRQAIRDFGEKLKRADVGLFYYAGHGIQIKGRNYLVPLMAEVSSADEVQDESIDAGSILRKMESAGNDVNIVILDACRNNPFARSFRSLQQGLARMDGPVGSFIAYATAPGSVAADGSGRNGVYTQYLLEALDQPGLAIEQTFKYVRNGVKKATQGKQIPWESSSLMGEFVFSKADTPSSLPVSKPPPAIKKKYLQIISNVPHANVSINNINRGIVNNEGVLNIENILEDQVEVVLDAEGYNSARKKVVLVPNKWEQLKINLSPVQPQQTSNTKTQPDYKSCTENKRVILTSTVEFHSDKRKTVIKKNMPVLNALLTQAFKKYGLQFVDTELTTNKLQTQDPPFDLFKAIKKSQARYLVRFSSTVNERPIKVIKTNMKTITGELSLKMIDLKNREIKATISKSFNKAGHDRKNIVKKALKEQIYNLTEDIVKQVCES